MTETAKRKLIWERWQAMEIEQKRAVALEVFCLAFGMLQDNDSTVASRFFKNVEDSVARREAK
jgi:hypothetical protein